MPGDRSKELRKSLEQIGRTHWQGLYTLALTVTRDPQLAEEAVHEGFLRLCRLAPGLQGDGAVHAYGAVRDAAMNLRRRVLGSPSVRCSIFDKLERFTRGEAVETEAEARAQRIVEGLSEEHQQVLVLKLYAGLSFEQIASMLNEPVNAVVGRYRSTVIMVAQVAGNRPLNHDAERTLQALPLRRPSRRSSERIMQELRNLRAALFRTWARWASGAGVGVTLLVGALLVANGWMLPIEGPSPRPRRPSVQPGSLKIEPSVTVRCTSGDPRPSPIRWIPDRTRRSRIKGG